MTRFLLIIPAIAVAVAATSCRKEIQQVNWNNKALNTPATNANAALSADEKLRQITFDMPTQNVKTSVNGNVLTMVYKEEVNSMLDANGYDLSYSIRFNEDFATSALNKLSYTLPGPNGSYTTNWAGNDLKVLNEVTKTTVIVDGKTMVKLFLVRSFTFTKEYATASEAVNQQNILLNTKTDAVKFTSYVVFGKDYPATTASALLVYTK